MPAPTRRRFLGVAVGVAVVGCTDNGDDRQSIGDYPAIDEWLTDTSVGAADDTYDGMLADRRDRATVEIDVGAPGNGGNLAFGPSAVVVSSGSTIRWTWTGEGGRHTVEAEPADQIGQSDYEFSSGEPVDRTGETFEQRLSDPGVALYHCEPHLTVGMKGGIGVE